MFQLPTILDYVAVAIFLLVILLLEYRPYWCKLNFYISSSSSSIGTSSKSKGGKWRRKGVEDIPGPVALPILGTRWIYYSKYKLNKIHEAYKDMMEKYGPIMKEEALWNYSIVSVVRPEDIEKVYRQSGKYPLRPPSEITAHYRKSRPDRYTNTGLVNEQGEKWHQLRSLLTPELTSSKTIQSYYSELRNVVDDFIYLLSITKDDKQTIQGFEEIACRMGLESTCTLILGRRMGFLDKECSKVAQDLADAVQDQFCASRDTFYGFPFWKLYRTSSYKRFIESEDRIYTIISEMVDNATTEEKNTCSEDVQCVFMSILQAPEIDLRDKKAAIIDFIAAGIKTLGNTLVFLFYLLAKNPDAQKKLYDEISQLTSPGEPLTFASLRNATYLRACIMEGFRVLPTAPCVARILETEMEIGGYYLKPGSVVLCQSQLACLDEANFPNATSYIPERWLDPNTKINPFLVAPFGVGRRTCPGKRFVELELQIILAETLRKYEICHEGDFDLEFEFLLAPKGPVNFIFNDRC